jgi:hypothetical protein
MPSNLPYLVSYKNVGKLFEQIGKARTPDAVTHPFLQSTLGLKSTTDRPLIPLLRVLGFIDAAGKPTSAFALLKNPTTSKAAVAEAVRRAYKPLFDANENAHKLSLDELKGLVAQVAGTDGDMTTKIVGTLNALVKLGDFDAKKTNDPPASDHADDKDTKAAGKKTGQKELIQSDQRLGEMRPEFHFNIQVHLPANATEDVYLSIFTALRKAF